MKKPNYPEPDQVQKLIDKAERLTRLDAERESLYSELRAVTADLRTALQSATGEDDPNKSLDTLLKLYRAQGAIDRDVSVLLAKRDELSKKAEKTTEGLTSGRAELRPAMETLCARVEKLKLAEHEKLLREITAKLVPYCNGNDVRAQALAAETDCAVALYSDAARCRPLVYDDTNFATPLRAVLEIINN